MSTVAPAPEPEVTVSEATARGVLLAAREARATRDAGEVALLRSVIEWSVVHQTGRYEDAMWLAGYGDTGLTLGGPGCPLVRESALIELAPALGMSTTAGAAYVGEALELRYRLPRLWQRVLAGACPAWRARRIAAATIPLCRDGADHVDRHLAPYAHSVSFAQQQRLIEAALKRWDPETAEANRKAAAEHRHVHIGLTDHTGTTPTNGVVEVHAGLDLADALDFEAAIADRAHHLGRLGSQDPLGVRRSQALGEMARDQPTLDTHTDTEGVTDTDTEGEGDPNAQGSGKRRVRGRQVVLHAHLSAATLGNGTGSWEQHLLARLDPRHSAPGPILTEQVRAWCAGAAQITVRPVLDLAESIHFESYEASQRLKDQTDLRDAHCAFPHCTRPATRCDHDHVIAWPTGPTETENLAPACRTHHRAKTHLGWHYTVLTPGLYLWTSPQGYRYLRSHAGTHELDPPPPGDPPEALPEEPPRNRYRPPPAVPDTGPAGPADEDTPPPF